jgi:hypothetical protein
LDVEQTHNWTIRIVKTGSPAYINLNGDRKNIDQTRNIKELLSTFSVLQSKTVLRTIEAYITLKILPHPHVNWKKQAISLSLGLVLPSTSILLADRRTYAGNRLLVLFIKSC